MYQARTPWGSALEDIRGAASFTRHFRQLYKLMAILPRDFDDDTRFTDGARWAFFAIFIVLVLGILFGTLRVNKRRARHGAAPIYGTRWMTPPSYLQSQNQYDQPTRQEPDMPLAYVPKYTAEATEYDMGYYDKDGTFHANPNIKAPIPLVHHRTTLVLTGQPIQAMNVISDEDFYRTHPTQDASAGHFAAQTRNSSQDSLGPPSGPPPELSPEGSSSDLPRGMILVVANERGISSSANDEKKTHISETVTRL